MRIKELEDVLVLVDAMPRPQQLKCAKAMMYHVEYWEGWQAEGVSEQEWLRRSDKRREAISERKLKEALDALAAVQRKTRK